MRARLFTSSLAEQALRMTQVRQKVSEYFRTRESADVFFTVRSYLASLYKQHAAFLGA